MRKIILISIFSVALLAGNYKITQGQPLEIPISSDKPVVVDFNFKVKQAKLIQSDASGAAIETLEQGVVVIPKKSNPSGTLVVTAIDGRNYVVNIDGNGTETLQHIEDPSQEINDKSKEKIVFETDRTERDCRNIGKAILLQKPLSGFKKTIAPRQISDDEFSLKRKFRYIGGMYVADYWMLSNKTNGVLYFKESEFYTKGVLSVGLQKNRVEPGETIYMLMILNKHTIYESEQEGA